MLALATVARKSSNGTFAAKIFRSGILCFYCWCWHWKSKVSPHTILYVFGLRNLEFEKKNHMVWSIQNFEMFHTHTHTHLTHTLKMVNHIWQSVDAILEDVFVTETIVWCETNDLNTIIFQCSKNHCCPTRVTNFGCPTSETMVKSCTKHGRPNVSVLTKTDCNLNIRVGH